MSDEPTDERVDAGIEAPTDDRGPGPLAQHVAQVQRRLWRTFFAAARPGARWPLVIELILVLVPLAWVLAGWHRQP